MTSEDSKPPLGGVRKAGIRFIVKSLLLAVKSLLQAGAFFVSLTAEMRRYMIRKLVWGRGRLLLPVSHLGMGSLAFLVILSGSFPLGLTATPNLSLPSSSNHMLSIVSALPDEQGNERLRLEPLFYEVQKGDTLGKIGEQFRVSIDTIHYANDLVNIDRLSVGQKLLIPPVSGVMHSVKKGETVGKIASRYNVAPQAIIDFNYLNEPFALIVGSRIMVPDAKIPEIVRPSVAPAAPKTTKQKPAYGNGRLAWPTDFKVITQRFSYYHLGLDIGRVSPIYAAESGVVVEVRSNGWNDGFGKMIRMDHGGGTVTGYNHLAEIKVSVGQRVGRGEVIGIMGRTGRAYGVHLHFNVSQNGKFINPLFLLE